MKPTTAAATVSVHLIDAVLSAAERAGAVSAGEGLALRRQTRDAARGERVSVAVLAGLWRHLARLGGSMTVGARLARHADLTAFGILGAAMSRTGSAMAAYDHLGRFARLLHQGLVVTVERSPLRVAIGYAIARRAGERPGPGDDAAAVWALANMALVPERVCGVALRPAETSFACAAPADADTLGDLFGAVRFDAAAHRVVFERRRLEAVTGGTADPLLVYLDALARQDLAALPAADDVAARVTALLDGRLAGTPPDVGAVAAQLGLSRRTLQRRLTEMGTSFEALLDAVRVAAARRMLAAGRPMGEIAYLLGYAEPAVFSRAARRWFGTAPSRWRG